MEAFTVKRIVMEARTEYDKAERKYLSSDMPIELPVLKQIAGLKMNAFMAKYLSSSMQIQEILGAIRGLDKALQIAVRSKLAKPDQVHVLYKEENVVKGFDYNKIPAYCRDGVFIEKKFYDVSSPEIISPHYMSVNIASSYLYASFRHSVTQLRPKWDGEHVHVLRLASLVANAALLVSRDKVIFFEGDVPAQTLEVLPSGPVCINGFSNAPMSPLLHEVGTTVNTDGLIVVAVDNEFRVKDRKTYDLAVNNGALVDKQGKQYARCSPELEGKIVETSSSYAILKERPDKVSPLTTDQVNQVANSITRGSFPVPTKPVKAVVHYHLLYYVRLVVGHLMRDELMWTMDSVAAKCADLQVPYTKEEVYSAVAPFITPPPTKLTVDKKGLGISREGSELVISLPEAKALTVEAFLECVDATTNFSTIRKKLTNAGYVCTPHDWVALREVYFRGYKSVFVFNPEFITYCRAAQVYQPYPVTGKSNLPYMQYAKCGDIVDVRPSLFASYFSVIENDKVPVSDDELSSLSSPVYYVDIDELCAKLGRCYDPSTIALQIIRLNKILIGTRPYRMPTEIDIIKNLSSPCTVKKLAATLNVAVPYLIQVLDRHGDKFDYEVGGQVKMKAS